MKNTHEQNWLKANKSLWQITDRLDSWFLDYVDDTLYVVSLNEFSNYLQSQGFNYFEQGYLEAVYKDFLEDGEYCL